MAKATTRLMANLQELSDPTLRGAGGTPVRQPDSPAFGIRPLRAATPSSRSRTPSTSQDRSEPFQRVRHRVGTPGGAASSPPTSPVKRPSSRSRQQSTTYGTEATAPSIMRDRAPQWLKPTTPSAGGRSAQMQPQDHQQGQALPSSSGSVAGSLASYSPSMPSESHADDAVTLLTRGSKSSHAGRSSSGPTTYSGAHQHPHPALTDAPHIAR